MKDKDKKVIERIEDSIKNLNKKDFTVYFFIIDTKGTPNGSTQYIYEMAHELSELGYTIKMLHQEKEFVGVGEWLGEEYANLPHMCIENENISVSTSDFLLIPEIFANVMNQTKELPCKRIIICQNINYITEFIPLGVSWDSYNIHDVITTSETQKEDIKALFPHIKTKVVEPSIPAYFRDDNLPKKLTVSIVSKDQTMVNRIVKQFHWKFPQYKFVTFADLRGLARKDFAENLRQSAITVWLDDDTYFGYSPIEAIKSGSIVIGKVPNVIPEWMLNEEKTSLNNSGIWFNDLRSVQAIIANVIKSWMDDNIPEELTKDMLTLKDKYTTQQKQSKIEETFSDYIKQRIDELNSIKDKITNKQ